MASGSNWRHLNRPQTEEARRSIWPAYHGVTAKLQHFREKWFHLPETIRQLRRKHLVVIKEPPITFLPSTRFLNTELFAEILTNQRMRIQLPRMMRIFSCEESCPS
jgi:hypothetical protein